MSVTNSLNAATFGHLNWPRRVACSITIEESGPERPAHAGLLILTPGETLFANPIHSVVFRIITGLIRKTSRHLTTY